MREYIFEHIVIINGITTSKMKYSNITGAPKFKHENGMVEIDRQFTGLLDKKGIEIYESDVVKNSLNDILEIVWNEDRCCFQMQGRYENSYKQRQLDCDIVIDLNIEVIGNIFQNPELLK